MALNPYRPPSDELTAVSQMIDREAKEDLPDSSRRSWLTFGVLTFITPFMDVAGIALTAVLSESWTALDNLWIYSWLFPTTLIGGGLAVWAVGRPRLYGGAAYCIVGALLTWLNFEIFWGAVASV